MAVHLILKVQMSQSSPKSGRVVRSLKVFILSTDRILGKFGIIKHYLIFRVTEMKDEKKLVSILFGPIRI